MRRKQERVIPYSDDADIAAGISGMMLPSAPISRGAMSTVTSTSDIEFYEDLISEPVLVLGIDISHVSRNGQFLICASGVFFFSLLYGYLQELLSVQLCSRKLGLFLAVVQFSGYTSLAYVLRTFVYQPQHRRRMTPKSGNTTSSSNLASKLVVPFSLYLGLSLLRAVDLAMTNLAMQYINYPAKTLMKSSRVVFTMIFGVFITNKRYNLVDYAIVLCIVLGLVIFMHADATSSAVFEPIGVIMLTISLICDGAITNMSESIMNKYGVGQDEFIFRMYSIALVAIVSIAGVKGDLVDGMVWILQPGTYDEQINNVPMEQRSWSPAAKMVLMALFSSMGFFGSSCAAAITKQFGALSMSITSTARKATTLFLSFALFDNECTYQHLVGIIIFIFALTAKSVRRKGKKRRVGNDWTRPKVGLPRGVSDLEFGGGPIGSVVVGGVGTSDGGDPISRASSRDYESSEDISVATMESRTVLGGFGPGRRNVGSSSSPHPSPNRGGGADHTTSQPRYHVV